MKVIYFIKKIITKIIHKYDEYILDNLLDCQSEEEFIKKCKVL